MDILQWLQDLAWETVKFLVFGVGVGYLLKKWVGDQIVKHWNRWKSSTPRKMAIWEHYHQKHATEDVLDCDHERCTVFKTYAS